MWHGRVRVLLSLDDRSTGFQKRPPIATRKDIPYRFFITAVATRSQHYLLTRLFLLVFQCNKSCQFVSVTSIIVTVGSSTDSGVTFWLLALESSVGIVGPLLSSSFSYFFWNDVKMSFMDWK